MKIIYCTRDLTVGGVGSQLVALLKEFDRNPAIEKILVIAPEQLEGFSQKIQFKVVRLWGRFFLTKEPLFAIQCYFLLKNICKAEHYDIIHALFTVFFPKVKAKKIRTSYSFHLGNITRNTLSNFFHKIYSILDYVNFKQVDAVTFQGITDMNFAIKKMPFIKNKSHHIRNFIDIDKFSLENIKREDVLKKHNLPLNKKFILSAARFEPQKGINDLMEISELIYKNFTDVEHIIAGDGPDKRLVLNSKAAYIGKVPNEQMKELYAITDIYLSASYYECGVPQSLMETMYCGCMPLFTAVGDQHLALENNPELIINQKNHPEVIAKIRNVLAFSEEKKEALRKKHRQTIIEKHWSKNNTKIILALYNKLIANSA